MRLEKVPSAPPRIAKMPATMMDEEARGAEGMHKFYSRARTSGEGNCRAEGA